MIKFPVVQVPSPEQLSELCRHGVFRSSVGKKTKQNKNCTVVGGDVLVALLQLSRSPTQMSGVSNSSDRPVVSRGGGRR